MDILRLLERRSRSFNIVLSLALVFTLGVVDYATGYEVAFSLFYVIPVFLATWLSGRGVGLAMSLVSAFVWLLADAASGLSYSSTLVTAWDTAIRLSFFVIITFLLSSLRGALEHEKQLARTDSLTGAVNSRFFFDLLQIEIERSQRHGRAFTLAYIDLDNFKSVNDEHGHRVGDRALQTIVDYARSNLRSTDVIARVGGDEFVLLLPETNQDAAQSVLTKIQSGLLGEMRRNGWPVTFSIGVVTASAARPTSDELIRIADSLMYSAKRGGKNAIEYGVYRT